ncbi:hypothetical protein L198_05529 [Cryptococcus wingfieldii CBS 7118]|uniref:Uncharacterized protein n=1 Tax=Cryptococcus wingfieldii CBS 7118 TaxID=1295528 RepID=A0A1E3IWD0_9TREE|nr:hypothetical protein L198_05529 [Cryptococcus wingfieldii CBS 7118]ODN92735.1 hypothetical protein L198_05529 [Cryptococcus wingfieldii CBS 7118]
MDLTLQLLLVASGFGDGHQRMRAALSHTRVLHIHDHRVSLDGTFPGVKVLVLHELVLHASFYIDTRHPMRGFFQTLLSRQFSDNIDEVVGVLDPSDHPLAIEESIQELLCFSEALRAPIITLEGAAGSSILKALSVTSGKLPICWSGAKLLRIRIGPAFA